MDNKLDPRLKKRIEQAMALRNQWEDILEEAYEYALPQRENFSTRSKGSQKNEEKTYDSTAMHAVQGFAAKMQQNLVPPKARWASLVPADDIQEDQKIGALKWCQDVTKVIFKAIHNSNLDNEIGEAFQDLAVGTGAIAIEATNNKDHPIRCTAIPASELILEPGPHNRVETVFREYRLSVRNLCATYPDVSKDRLETKQNKPDEEVVIVEGVVYDYETGKYEFYAIDWAMNHIMQYKEMDTSPYIVFRWSKTPGEVYGRGPVIRCLPDIRALNQLVKLELQAAAFAVNGVYTLNTDQGTPGRNFKIEPGGIIALHSNSKLENLNVNTQLQVSQLAGDKLREDIKMELFADRLPPLQAGAKTATEINARQQELHGLIGPAFGRLTHELIEPIIRRYISILQDEGILKAFKFDNKMIKVKVQSPISRNSEELKNLHSYISGLLNLMTPMGEQGLKLLNDEIDFSKIIKISAEMSNVDLGIFRSEEQKKQMAEAEQEQQQQQQGLAQAQQLAGIAKDVGLNAETLTGGGSPGGPPLI